MKHTCKYFTLGTNRYNDTYTTIYTTIILNLYDDTLLATKSRCKDTLLSTASSLCVSALSPQLYASAFFFIV